jgi:hypothetical protein
MAGIQPEFGGDTAKIRSIQGKVIETTLVPTRRTR